MKKTLKLGKKAFKFLMGADGKNSAKKYAANLRKTRGYSVRIVKRAHAYGVFVRKKGD